MNVEQRKALVAAVSSYLYNSDEVLEAPDDAASRLVAMVEQELGPALPAPEFPLFLHSDGYLNVFRSVAGNRIAICFKGLDEGDTDHTQYSRLTRGEAQAIIARLTDLVNKLPEDAHEA